MLSRGAFYGAVIDAVGNGRIRLDIGMIDAKGEEVQRYEGAFPVLMEYHEPA
jgi:hypothetical protein